VVSLKFASKYQIQSATHQTIIINQRRFHDNDILFLYNRTYSSEASANYRLKLIPQVTVALPSTFQHDEWEKIIY
jgi:hypothetical protein